MTRIGLIGDYDESVPAHRAIPTAIGLAAESLRELLELEWLPTDVIRSHSDLDGFHALWCVPGSPYRSMAGALLAIRCARERGLPFLGTCGGFQHGVIEYARNVLGWRDADHAETAPDASALVIAPLECALVEATAAVRLHDGTHLRSAYGAEQSTEEYRCRFGLNPAFRQALLDGGDLRVAATDADGDIRGLELEGHPFYVMTLFQPERAALRGVLPPIVSAFAAAGVAQSARTGRDR